MKKILLSVIAMQSLVGGIAFSAPNNTMLQFTMKAIAKDVSYIAYPAKQESPLDVTEEALVTAIARARTAGYQLQLVLNGQKGEFFPTVLQDLPEAEKNTKLVQYTEHLKKAMGILATAEKQLLTEHAKTDLSTRDFQSLRQTLGDLDAAIKEAHGVFHPQKPQFGIR